MAERTEIDGVPVFWADAPPPFVAALVFRVGMSDEVFLQRGLTHLVEHLTLSGIGKPSYPYNGSVDLTTTTFVTQGTPADGADFLSRVAGSLASLPFARLETELGVLRTEESRRSSGPWSRLLALRFGCAGYGLPDFPELALQGVEPDTVDRWRQQWFNAANAVVMLSGPPPPGIDLSALARGAWRPPADPRPILHELPGWALARDNLVACSMLAARSRALDLGIGILGERLRTRLRDELGLSYEVGASGDRLTAHHSLVLVLADAVDDRVNEAREILATELSRFRLQGPTDAELDDHRTELARRRAADPRTEFGLAGSRAFEWLFAKTNAEPPWEDEVASLTAADLKAACAAALGSAIWLLPPGAAGRDKRLVRITTVASTGFEGAGHLPVAALRKAHEGQRLVVDPSGLTRWYGEDAVTVRFAECTASQAWQDGARTVWGTDGRFVFVHPDAWVDGASAVQAIDVRIGDSRIVQMRSPSGFTLPDDEPATLAPLAQEVRPKRRSRRRGA